MKSSSLLRRAGAALIVTAAIAAVLAASTPALARRGRGGSGGGGSSARVRRDYRLAPTQAGAADRLHGNARVESRSGREKLKVEVETANTALPGTTYDAYVLIPSRSAEPVFFATVTLGVHQDDSNSRSTSPLRRGRGGDDDGDDDSGSGGRGGDDSINEIEGEVEISIPRLPASVTPVTDITGFIVKDPRTNQVVLTSTSK